ncbi:unnamed protein product, partial [Allacma fusca]
MKTQN